MKAKEELFLEDVLPNHAERLVRCVLGHYPVRRPSCDRVTYSHYCTNDRPGFFGTNDDPNS